jgi:hypothetical protein
MNVTIKNKILGDIFVTWSLRGKKAICHKDTKSQRFTKG